MHTAGLSAIRNIFFPTSTSIRGAVAPDADSPGGSYSRATGLDTSAEAQRRNLSNYITPVQLARLKVDIGEYRRSIGEAEFGWYPHRVRMQRMFIDTVLNGHVYSCMDRRKDLTLLRGYEIGKMQGENWVPSKVLTQEFESYTWFNDWLEYALDAIFFGYSLISLGDVEGGMLKDVGLIRRWNISPDREVVSQMIYNLDGKRWDDDDTRPWHIYVKTKSENGVSKCGYGLLYKVALYEIFMRNVLGYNGDFVELYSQPYRVAKTTKTTEIERAELEAAVRNMGSAGYAILDPYDEITFLETHLGGTGWQGYDNLEKRCMQTISKLILGHADAMDSVPGKLGGAGNEGPAAEALEDKQTKDGHFITPYVNNELLWRIRENGSSSIPEGYIWRLKNDDEQAESKKRENENRQAYAQIALTMKNAGLQMQPEHFEEVTGIPTEKIEAQKPEPESGLPEDVNKLNKLKDKMELLYAK